MSKGGDISECEDIATKPQTISEEMGLIGKGPENCISTRIKGPKSLLHTTTTRHPEKETANIALAKNKQRPIRSERRVLSRASKQISNKSEAQTSCRRPEKKGVDISCQRKQSIGYKMNNQKRARNNPYGALGAGVAKCNNRNGSKK
ncbi:17695_t:CDS:2, partial [Gigaspora rosea]